MKIVTTLATVVAAASLLAGVTVSAEAARSTIATRSVVHRDAPMATSTVVTARRPVKIVWTTATYRYGTTARMNLIARYPRGATGRPWVLAVHGGGWVSQDNTTMAAADALFNAHGFDTFAINYDLATTPGVTEYTQRYEVRIALAWVRSHAAAFGINPLRGALYGYSAGGHLALIAGLTDPKIKAILTTAAIASPERVADDAQGARADAEPPNSAIGETDIPGLYHNAVIMTGGCKWLTGRAIGTLCAARWRDFEPADQISSTSAPVLLFAGSADVFYTAQQGAAFCDAMHRAVPRRSCTLVTKAGYPHGQRTFLDSAAQGLAFLATHV